jgi:16S rRNA (cytosine1402-N4)-methyltransferase
MPQFKERGRGFSFETDEPLDMRYDPSATYTTAERLLNESTEQELEKIFRFYGEEPFSRAIAEALVAARIATPLATTGDLVKVVLEVYRKKLHSTKEVPWTRGIHPATRVFQALRIAVNQEFEVLKQVLPQALRVLKPGGRLAVITFHSLEDRIVKHYFMSEHGKKGMIITKKPLLASEGELAENAAARSAKLRVFQKNNS